MDIKTAVAGVTTDPDLTTTQAARIAGVSRQHVVDLCERGVLPHHRVGTHRRVRVRDLERHLSRAGKAVPTMTRKDRISLAIHLRVAERLLIDEARTREQGSRNLATMRVANRDGAATVYLDEWGRLLDGPLAPLLTVLTALDHHARDLRNVTPFAGVISDARRRELIRKIR